MFIMVFIVKKQIYNLNLFLYLELIMAHLLKPKAKSLVVSSPFAEELKNHIAMVEERELQTIKEKLSRQQQKEQRVNAIQKQFLEWADKKQNKIKQKIQKSTKLKEDHLNKIVKKCKQHQKYLGQKLKQFKTKNKMNLKQAWKKVEEYNKYNQNKESYYTTSKQISQNRSSPKLKTHNDISQSRVFNGYQRQPDRQYLVTSYNNASKYLGNSSKQYLKELNQSIRQLQSNPTATIQKQEEEPEREHEISSKLKQTLARFKNFIEKNEQQKIQQLGKRFEKIEQSRIRKQELNSKKKHHNRTLIENDQDRRRQQKSKPNRTERLHSQSFTRQKRVNDWSEANKQKREEMFQMHLQNGTQYLQEQKLKYMKNSLSKKVAVSAVEKKLYFQRLNH